MRIDKIQAVGLQVRFAFTFIPLKLHLRDIKKPLPSQIGLKRTMVNHVQTTIQGLARSVMVFVPRGARTASAVSGQTDVRDRNDILSALFQSHRSCGDLFRVAHRQAIWGRRFARPSRWRFENGTTATTVARSKVNCATDQRDMDWSQGLTAIPMLAATALSRLSNVQNWQRSIAAAASR